MTNNNSEVSAATTTTPLKQNLFSPGTEVEVSSDEEGFKGAWFRAAIISNKDPSSALLSNNSNPNPNPSSSTTTTTTTFKRRRKVLVEYRNLVTEDGSEQLRENVDLSHLRPLPPEIASPSFEVGDVVDADYRDGWWTGVVKKVLGDSKFRVFFDNPPDLIEFHHSQMRFHQDWINNHWIRPKREPQMAGSHFSPGTDVEVNIADDDDLTDAWIPSIVVKENKDNTFLVKFQNSTAKHWGHTVDFLHIRPPAPHYADRVYKLHEKVDAFHDSAWRAGVISKILYGKTYVVTLHGGMKSKDLNRGEIRPRLEWKGGKWEIESKEPLATSNSIVTDELGETAKKKSKSAETAIQPESQGSDKLEKKTLQPLVSGTSLTEQQSIDKKVEPISSVTTSSAPSNRIGRGRRSKVFKDGIKENDVSELGTPATERVSTRTRKPVVPFKFENFPKTRRHSDAPIEDQQTAPVKRMGRPKKSEVTNSVTLAVGEAQNANSGAVNKLFVKKGVNNETVVPSKLVDKKGVKNETELPSKLVDKKGVKNEIKLPSNVASSSRGTKDLAAKVSSQSFNKELQILTIDVKQSADELEIEERERMQAESGVRSSNKRKRGRPPRKLLLLCVQDSDGDNPQNGAEPIQDIQKACPVNDITLPNQGGANELDLQDTSRRKRRDVSPTKAVKNESVKVSGSQGNSLDDDDRPLSTWFGAMQNQPEALGKNVIDQQNGIKEHANVPNEASVINASSDGAPGENQRFPFTKKSPIWNVVESMEIFRVMPQSPHFRPLLKCKEECREGLAIGHMVTFSSLVDKISKLRFEDRGSNFSGTLESLLELENQGFDISVLRDRVSELSSIRDKLEPVHKEAKDIETKIKEHSEEKTKLVSQIEDVEKKMSELRDKHELIRVQIEVKDVEVDKLQQNLDVAYGNISNLRRSFEKLRCSPFKDT